MADLVKSSNALRGEVTVTLGGKQRKLRLTIGQLENLEEELGCGAPEIFARLVTSKFTTRQLRTLIAEACKKTPEHPRPSLDEVWEWIVVEGFEVHQLTAGELLMAALGKGKKDGGKDEDENPPSAESE